MASSPSCRHQPGAEHIIPLRQRSLLRNPELFATDNMIPYRRAVRELQDLPLKDHVREGWPGGNAARLTERAAERSAGL